MSIIGPMPLVFDTVKSTSTHPQTVPGVTARCIFVVCRFSCGSTPQASTISIFVEACRSAEIRRSNKELESISSRYPDIDILAFTVDTCIHMRVH